MTGVIIQGGLGNQMFQYAYAQCVARERNTVSFLDDSKEQFRIFELFCEPFFFRIRNFVKMAIFDLFYRKNALVLKESDFPENRGKDFGLFEWQPSNCMIEGFFQSIMYASLINTNIHQLFRVRRKHVIEFRRKYGKLFEGRPTIVAHYRAGDYADWGNEDLGGKGLILPLKYYDECLMSIGDLKDYRVIFVTNSPSDIEAYCSKNGFELIHDSEVMDFQLIQNANTVICSNSTFAWWATVLNPNSPRVFVPRYWAGFKVGKEYPNGILSGLNWTLVDVPNLEA